MTARVVVATEALIKGIVWSSLVLVEVVVGVMVVGRVKVWRGLSRCHAGRLIYLPSRIQSILRSPITNFGTGFICLAGDFQATKVPRVLHVQPTDGNSKISPLKTVIDGQDANTSGS